MNMLLDCGHCLQGADTGAQGNGRKEQDCTREIGYKVKSKLESLGHTVVICFCDSASNVMESLAYRVNTANANGGDLYISIHINAGGGYGSEIFTFGAKHFAEADNILNELVALGFQNRGIKDGSGLYVIKHTNMKSMLVECCFIDTNDMDKYSAENFANAIVKGITGQTVQVPTYTTVPLTHTTTTTVPISQPTQPSESKSLLQIAKEFIGDRAKELQTKLIACGFNCGGYGADGSFGQGTLDSLISFQTKYLGVSQADGLCGNLTFQKLQEVINQMNRPKVFIDQALRLVQYKLNRLKIHDSNGNSLQEDGISGYNTNYAINTFEGIMGLNQDHTWGNQCEGAYQQIISKPYCDINNQGGKYAVRYLQFIANTATDGIWGSGTNIKVKSWQSNHSLTADSKFGNNSWNVAIG